MNSSVPRYHRAPEVKKTAHVAMRTGSAIRQRSSRSISRYISAFVRGTVTAFLVPLAVSIGYTGL